MSDQFVRVADPQTGYHRTAHVSEVATNPALKVLADHDAVDANGNPLPPRTATEWARAGVLHPVVAYSTEFIEVWFARGLTAGERAQDAGEFLDVYTATPQE